MKEKIKTQEGLFEKEDYALFMLSVFILGGLLVLPLVWGFMTGLNDYIALLIFSLMLCVSVLVVYRRDGTTSWIRIVLAIIVGIIVSGVVAAASEKLAFVSGVIIGFFILILCGFVGIKIFKLFIKNKIKKI